MSQFLTQIPRQALQQQQRLTPQLIQAMDILQLPMLALEARIAAEMDANPALEYAPGDEEGGAADETPAPVEKEWADGERRLDVQEGSPEEFERLDRLVTEYDWIEEDEYRGRQSHTALSEAGDAKQDAMSNAAARPVGLQEFLLEQWAFADIDPRTREIGARIIGTLDEAGRLTGPLEALAADVQPPASAEELDGALFEVQQLDPPGVAARTIQESLLLQLDALPGNHDLTRRIIAEHFDDLQRNRLPQIAKALSANVEQVKDAIAVMARLSLSPGLDVVERSAPAIVPDLTVEFNDDAGRYDVRLTRGNSRELHIAPEFRALLEQAQHDKQTRDFVKQKIEAAGAIIDAVRYRRERLLEVAKAVVEAQRDFLDYGEQHLKVLRMNDLAERFSCDPSTISRTVDDKYMQTPRGIFPLRRFFTGGTESESGEVLGWDSIKAKVEEIVAKEDKREPLSDDAIVELLHQQGIEIKRRTIAKYRAQLNIPPKHQRKRY